MGGEETRAKGAKGAKVKGIKDGEIMTGRGGGCVWPGEGVGAGVDGKGEKGVEIF